MGALDEPRPDEVFVHWVDVKGWALSADGDAVDVAIEVDGRVVCERAPRITRPDVEALFRSVPGASDCGFGVRLSSELPDRGSAVITVTAVTRGRAATKQQIGSTTVRRYNPEEGAGNVFGAVWDSVSPSVAAARVAVCTLADEGVWQGSGKIDADTIASATGIGPADVVLDIGCGPGRVGRHMAPRCARWIGADVSENMLRFAREALADLGNVSFVRLNGFDLTGVGDGSVDVVYCMAVFMHLEEWERYRYILEARRVLKAGGWLYVNNFNLLSEEGWKFFEGVLALDPARRPLHSSRHSTPQELEAFVTRAGFEDIQVQTGGLWISVTARRPAA
jgi:SAM-dependent methyltransferase